MKWFAQRVLPVLLMIGLAGAFVYSTFPKGARPASGQPSVPEAWPVGVTEGLQSHLQVQVNGLDWWKETPVLRSGQTDEISALWIGPEDANVHQVLLIAPRPQSDPGFEAYDPRTDVGLSTHGKPHPWNPRLTPGTYTVRFYLRTMRTDLSKEAKSVLRLVGERRLVVEVP